MGWFAVTCEEDQHIQVLDHGSLMEKADYSVSGGGELLLLAEEFRYLRIFLKSHRKKEHDGGLLRHKPDRRGEEGAKRVIRESSQFTSQCMFQVSPMPMSCGK